VARLPRLIAPGWPHLVIQRGHPRQSVFADEADRRQFLLFLREVAVPAGVAIHAYGLLDDEVQLLATPGDAESLSRVMQGLGRRYGAYYNRRHDSTGGLWEGRFRSTVVDPERHLLACMRYIEEGAGVSSAAHHIGERVDPLVHDHALYWALGNTPFERQAAYRHMLEHPLSGLERQQIRDAALKSWPLGSEQFLAGLAAQTDRRLSPLKRGRPRKTV
jgi:putative transposase